MPYLRGHAPRLPLAVRFWQHVEQGDGCWRWRGRRTQAGYGSVSVRAGQRAVAHRVSWELTFGPIPPGKQINHHCDVRLCVRPDHLYVGTHQDNMDDMKARNRVAAGAHDGTHTHPERFPRGTERVQARLTLDVEHPALINEAVPYGYCQCGCGAKTTVARSDDPRYGTRKGQPQRYIRGHQAHGRPFIRPPQYVEVDMGYRTPCHIWQAKICHWGYGVLRSGMTGVSYRAHRALYEALVRPLERHEVLDHLCRQKACVNPEHLEPVCQRTNLRRGKHTKLRAEDVVAIRASAQPYAELAARYGVSASTICNIQRRRTWQSLSD